jgi:hypothetical protein
MLMPIRTELLISVIPGGLPSAGRNRGARRATTPYVLSVAPQYRIDGKYKVSAARS